MRKIKNLFALSAMLVITLFSSCEKDDDKPKTGEYDLTINGESYTGTGVTFSEKDEYFYSIKIEDGIELQMFVYRDSLDAFYAKGDISPMGELGYKTKVKIYGPDESAVNIMTTGITRSDSLISYSSYKGDVIFVSKNEIHIENGNFDKFDVDTNTTTYNIPVSGVIKY